MIGAVWGSVRPVLAAGLVYVVFVSMLYAASEYGEYRYNQSTTTTTIIQPLNIIYGEGRQS